MYKISVIVPVFNVEDTLQNAFDSILNQSIGFENITPKSTVMSNQLF